MSTELLNDLIFEKARPGENEILERQLRSAFDPYVGLPGRELGKDAYDWQPGSIDERRPKHDKDSHVRVFMEKALK